jgi:hypothetical protein
MPAESSPNNKKSRVDPSTNKFTNMSWNIESMQMRYKPKECTVSGWDTLHPSSFSNLQHPLWPASIVVTCNVQANFSSADTYPRSYTRARLYDQTVLPRMSDFGGR